MIMLSNEPYCDAEGSSDFQRIYSKWKLCLKLYLLFFWFLVGINYFILFLLQVHTKTAALIQTPVLVSPLQTNR